MIRKLFILIILINITLCFSLEVGFTGGVSTLNYAELGSNNKDDLYTFNSTLFGVDTSLDFDKIFIKNSIKTEVPYNLSLTDSFGKDDDNYLINLIYFGGNLQLGIGYKLLSINSFFVKSLVLVNLDYIYLRDNLPGHYDEYTYFVLGPGLEIDAGYKVSSKISLSVRSNFSFNLLPINNRAGTLKFSNNWQVLAGISYLLF